MNFNHEGALPAIWKNGRLRWRDKVQALQGMWSLLLWSNTDSAREVEERQQLMGDLEFLTDIAFQHHYTDRALAA